LLANGGKYRTTKKGQRNLTVTLTGLHQARFGSCWRGGAGGFDYQR